MSRVLLDTHALYWVSEDPRRLSKPAAGAIAAADEVFASIASCWELAIKASLGHFELKTPLDRLLEQTVQQGMRLLGVELPHVMRIVDLPFHHRDPFDRMLIAQALVEKVAVVSKDAVLDAYGVRRIW